PEDWDLEGLHRTITTYYPSQFSVEDLKQAAVKEELVESFVAEATAYYEERERVAAEQHGDESVWREVEREVMLQIIDARWREHLSEMDYLRDGINLRAMGQKDPLVEWQTDGYEMFGQLIGAINNDYLTYVMHVDVAPAEIAQPEVQLEGASFAAPEDSPQGSAAIHQAAVAEVQAQQSQGMDVGAAFAATGAPGDGVTADQINTGAPVAQVVRSEHEKTGRNEPCWCGSGKKFKQCHGS
ncbi:MAG: preprotein translocase subunit SecA, partial [Actinomycetota bacterium]